MDTSFLEQDLEQLKAGAVERLTAATDGFVRWSERVRDPRGPFRMRWAVDSVREANVAASNYILGQLKEAGILHRVLDAEQQRQGRQWVESLQVAPGSYEDPALLAYKPPIWDDAAEPWPPTAAHKEAMNQYSHGCLRGYGVDGVDQLQIPPPPDWPQQDEPERVLPWIKSVEPNWSWIGRMTKRLADWRLAGTTPIDPLLDCLRWVYSRQDPRTGFWGPGIQTTFKILIAVFEPMGLTVPRAETLIDSVLAKMYHPEYDDNLFPCEEFDAFYDLAAANDHAPGYRREEILKLAAHRIAFILDTRLQADEGLASYPDHCIPTWLKWDMAPSVAQGDAFGLAIYGAGFAICVDLLGIQRETGWRGAWRYRHANDDTAYKRLGAEVRAALA